MSDGTIEVREDKIREMVSRIALTVQEESLSTAELVIAITVMMRWVKPDHIQTMKGWGDAVIEEHLNQMIHDSVVQMVGGMPLTGGKIN